MTPLAVDLPRLRAGLQRLDALVKEHPELAGDAARERFDAWIEAEERASSVEGRGERPGSRGD